MTQTDVKTRITSRAEDVGMNVRGQDCLVVIYTPNSEQLGLRVALGVDTVQIGRGSDNTIVLRNDSVSRRHAKVEFRESLYFLTDLDSLNGTYVNDEPIQDHLLKRGDLIKIGDTIIKFLSGNDVESQYHDTIYRMTITDGLTGISNRRSLDEAAHREVSRARRHNRPLSMVMIDVDHFKQVNDEYGHLAGDHILKEVAQLIQARLRPDDIFARYGGEEFAILLPETNSAGALTIADELRKKIEHSVFAFDKERISVTISLGVAELQPERNTADLMSAADQQLYRSKNEGRNRVSVEGS